jgi:hypothetical protein
MTPKKKMVVANVAIQISKEDPQLCEDTVDKACRFLNDVDEICVLFDKPLKVTKDGEQFFLRCKPCLTAEPG